MDPESLNNLFQSVAQSFDPTGFEASHAAADLIVGMEHWPSTHLTSGDELLPRTLSKFAQKLSMRPMDHTHLTDPEQVFLLQVFVEKVGIWMDSMDEMKHVCYPLLLISLLSFLMEKSSRKSCHIMQLTSPCFGTPFSHVEPNISP
jgi:hypothetical protein